MKTRIEAAGGVVMRKGPEATEIAVVHRPRYDDWSFPKGKLDGGESSEEAALREVREETGLTCRLGPELPFAQYEDDEGRPKTVRYWLMAVVEDGGFEPDDEVDELRWLVPEQAGELLTYSRDRALVKTL
ncbi:MAG: NUDIX hydrolase [Thermoleophilaceae bacterium]